MAVVFVQTTPTRCAGFGTLISSRDAGAVAEKNVPGDADPLLDQFVADALDADASADTTIAPITSTFRNLRDIRSS
ncbi:MAG TPA: hypothetical protein VK501_05405 [Baekduia sp.]|uniref:hypothetical protein n=1 Tax=Baekduia sp. TaxID=2600305 RepID=UPI002D0022BA|nr:hypothetical protein [Baekduia sp.]HMJ33335.1 hypothetical protein [Baekduia sp.]